MFKSPNASVALVLGTRCTRSEFIAKFEADHPDAAIEHFDAFNSFFSIMISLGGLKAVGDGIYESVRTDSCDKIFELYMTHKRNSGDFL
jgi:hypothetical protein